MRAESVHGGLPADAGGGHRRFGAGRSAVRGFQSSAVDARASRRIHRLCSSVDRGEVSMLERLASQFRERNGKRSVPRREAEQGRTRGENCFWIRKRARAMPSHGTDPLRGGPFRPLLGHQSAQDKRACSSPLDDHPLRLSPGAVIRLAESSRSLAGRANAVCHRYPVVSSIRDPK